MKRASSRRGGLVVLGIALAALRPAHADPERPAAPAPSAAASAKPAAPAAPATSAAASAKPAAPAAPATPAKPKKLDAAKIAEDLDRPDARMDALVAVTSAGPDAKKLAPRIEELLARGLPPDLAIAAIGALGAIGAPTSSPVVAPYVSHRAASVRRAAAVALGRTGGSAASGALRRALRSTDASLRSAAASSLGSAGGAEAVPDLLRALDLGVTEAAPSIAALCTGAACDDLLARWEKLSSEGRQAVVGAMLSRAPALPDALLLRAVDRLRASEGAQAQAVFRTFAASFKGSAKVRAALRDAARAAAEAAKKGASPSPKAAPRGADL